MRGIRKKYPGVVALDGVDLDVRAGEVHVLLGENGAGKSTLMKILSGTQRRDAGTIRIHAREVVLGSPRDAQAEGIAIIHQELALVPELSAAENIFLGRLPSARGFVQRSRMEAEAQMVLQRIGADIDPRRPVGSLSLAQRQLVEIARALSLNARIVIMDEPTSALSERETARLFDIIRALTSRGTAVIYISHRLDEITAIGDRVTVLRDGRHVATQQVATADVRALVRLMTDRATATATATTATATAAAPARARGAVRLRVEQLGVRDVVRDVTFDVHAGEIVGLAGLMGAGRTELARAIFGAEPCTGRILIDGHDVRIDAPRDAITAGIGFVTEDRKREGLLLDRPVRENVVLPILKRLSRGGFVNRAKEHGTATAAVHELQIRTPSVEQHARHLSGGNQQKVVLAKWLATGARILLLDEPTRGVDAGAKQEIHALIAALASRGTAIVLISSELPEVLALSDRVLVMREGRIAGQFMGAAATAECVMACAVGM